MNLMQPPESTSADNPTEEPQFLEIDTGWKKRWAGIVAYVLIVILVSAALMWMFARFTSSWPLSAFLVACMVVYMLVMGRVASRRLEHTDDGNLR